MTEHGTHIRHDVCIVLPVKNGAPHLANAVAALAGALEEMVAFSSTILIVENGSTDSTPALANRLAQEFLSVRVLQLPVAGRGGALRTAWSSSDAAVLAYMDVDLATDLAHLPELLETVLSGQADVAFGSRLKSPRRTRRGWQREVLSRGYSTLVSRLLSASYQDAQCGFKAISRRVAQVILPLVQDRHWFFDTELLTLAERAGCRLHEFPVRWQDRPQSTVKILPTVAHMLRGIVRLRRSLRHGLAEEGWRSWQSRPLASEVSISVAAASSR